MQKNDDWKDLGSVMANHSISPILLSTVETIDFYKKAIEAWESLWKRLRQEGTAALLDNFIREHGDLEIKINAGAHCDMEEMTVRGTGSPN